MSNDSSPAARRRFLRFLAGSPVVASLGGVAAFMRQEGFAQDMREIRESGFASAVRDRMSYVESPAEALTVFDFEETARRKVQPGHWAYMASGTDDDATLYANRQAFRQVQLRPRRLRDATKVDMRVDLFGTTYASPVFTCPTGGQGSMHSDAELGVARAAQARGTLLMLSTATGTPLGDVNKALGRPVWQQLYAPANWDACVELLKRIEAEGVTVIALTCDNTTGRFSETFLRTRPKDLKQCQACHTGGFEEGRHRPLTEGIDMRGERRINPAMDWRFVERLRNYWKGMA